MSDKNPPIAVIDYGAGNLRSCVRALARVGAPLQVTSDPEVVRAASVVVLPGVGATRDTMDSLNRLGLVEPIREHIARGAPFLGICVGMQVLCDISEEFGDHACLEVVRGSVRRFPGDLKVPQIGWNQVSLAPEAREHPLFEGIADGSDFYFVHSYFCDLRAPELVAGATEYGVRFPSILLRGRLAGVQFHPEKSGTVGLRLLENFVTWAGAEVTRSRF